MHPTGSWLPAAALVLVLGISASASASESGCDRPVADLLPILERMERSWSEVTDYTARLLKTERLVDGTVTEENGIIRFRKPDQLHLRVTEGPNTGAVVLFPKPGTKDIVLGRPGGVSGTVAGLLVKLPAIGGLVPHEFPLDDPRLTDGQHHPLPDSSIGGMIELIADNVKTAARHREGSVCLRESETIAGHRSVTLEVHLPADKGSWHTATKGESLWRIGQDYAQDRYVILYNNPKVRRWNSLRAGTRVFVPRYYAPRAMLWVSEEVHLPVRLRMYDNDGRIYESYTNADLRIDVGLSDDDFDPERLGFPSKDTAPSRPRARPASIR